MTKERVPVHLILRIALRTLEATGYLLKNQLRSNCRSLRYYVFSLNSFIDIFGSSVASQVENPLKSPIKERPTPGPLDPAFYFQRMEWEWGKILCAGPHQAFDRDYRDVSGEHINRRMNVGNSILHP